MGKIIHCPCGHTWELDLSSGDPTPYTCHTCGCDLSPEGEGVSMSSLVEAKRKQGMKKKKKKKRCWTGYEPVPGMKPYSKGSCRKVGASVEEMALAKQILALAKTLLESAG